MEHCTTETPTISSEHVAIDVGSSEQTQSTVFPRGGQVAEVHKDESPVVSTPTKPQLSYTMPVFGSCPEPHKKNHQHQHQHQHQHHVFAQGAFTPPYPINMVHSDSEDSTVLNHDPRAVAASAISIIVGAVSVIAVLTARGSTSQYLVAVIGLVAVCLVLFGSIVGFTSKRYRVTVYRQGPSMRRVAIESARLLLPCTTTVTTHAVAMLEVAVVDSRTMCNGGWTHAVKLSVANSGVSAFVFLGDELTAQDAALAWKRYIDLLAHSHI